MDISCCLPNLAFHTPMLALLSFCRVHSSKMGANHVDSRKCWFAVWVDSFLHLDSQLTNIHLLAESFWRIITNPVVVRTTQCVRELVVSMALCAVFSIFFWKRLIQSQHLRQQAPKEPRGFVGILTQAHEKTQGETLRTECKKKTWKPCWGSKSNLGTSSKSPPESKDSWQSQPRNLISAVNLNTREGAKHLPFVCGAGNFIKSWLQLPKFLLFTLLETTCPKSA